MSRLTSLTLGLALLFSPTLAAWCRPFNQIYPAPRNISSRTITSTSAIFNQRLQELLANQTIAAQLGTNTTSFSLDVYSLHAPGSILTYHHSAPSLALSSEGVKQVTSNTIYRMASVSKAWTVYIWLMAVGDTNFNDPITKYVPELAEYASNHDSDDALNVVDWNSITVGALASQLGGIARDVAGGPQTDNLFQPVFGLPSVSTPNVTFCGDPQSIVFPCTRADFFADLLHEPPALPPYQSPTYTNIAYSLLGLALESITNVSFPMLFDTIFTERLGLNSTFYAAPTSSNNSIVPTNATASLYNLDLRNTAPGGGYYSSTSDMQLVGRSILNSTFLPTSLTRKWLKPISFLPPNYVNEASQAVGAPWEIIRAPRPASLITNSSENVTATQKFQTWIYTKEGDLGSYSSLFALIPDLDIGFTVLTAGTAAHPLVILLSDILTETWIPSLFEQARLEASAVYAGAYTDSATNSSVIITAPDADDEDPGLLLTQLIYNGTDFLKQLGNVVLQLPQGVNLTVRLYPSGLKDIRAMQGAVGSEVEGWRATPDVQGADIEQAQTLGAFQLACWAWNGIAGSGYAGISFDDLRFRVQTSSDGSRKAVGFEAAALRVNMTRA